MKKIILLGATGSIGSQTLEVVREHSDLFQIIALSFGGNMKVGRQIIQEFHPEFVCAQSKIDAEILMSEFPNVKFVYGLKGLREVAIYPKGELVLSAIMGSAGLLPTLDAIEAGKEMAIANKESLVIAGHLIIEASKRKGTTLLPVDSEHSAIFQCLQGEKKQNVKKLILTTSGGSLRDKTREELKQVTVKEPLIHPNWAMGNKLTIDSATMFNKGMEVIEAYWLYGIPYDNIEVVIHRESIVHSMVQFIDGNMLAQLGETDMRVPIQYALTYPERIFSRFNSEFDITKIGSLHFEKFDFKRFPALRLAIDAGKIGGSMPAVLTAANEIAVAGFLNGQVAFHNMEALVENAMNHHQVIESPNLETILEVDRETRAYVKTLF